MVCLAAGGLAVAHGVLLVLAERREPDPSGFGWCRSPGEVFDTCLVAPLAFPALAWIWTGWLVVPLLTLLPACRARRGSTWAPWIAVGGVGVLGVAAVADPVRLYAEDPGLGALPTTFVLLMLAAGAVPVVGAVLLVGWWRRRVPPGEVR